MGRVGKSAPNSVDNLFLVSAAGATMSPFIVWRKVRRNLQDHGWRVTIQKSLRYLLKPFYVERIYRIYEIDLRTDPSPARFPSKSLHFEARILSPDDAFPIRQIEKSQEWLENKLTHKIRGGGLCLAAYENDKLAGFNLISFGEVFIPLINRKRTFRKGEAWSEQIVIMKEFRNQGLGSELRYRIFDLLRSRGIRKLYGGTLVGNTASLNLAKRVGFRAIADVRYRKILSRETWESRRVRSLLEQINDRRESDQISSNNLVGAERGPAAVQGTPRGRDRQPQKASPVLASGSKTRTR